MVSDLRRRFDQAKTFVPLCSRVRTLGIYHLHVDVIRHIKIKWSALIDQKLKRICSYEMGVITVRQANWHSNGSKTGVDPFKMIPQKIRNSVGSMKRLQLGIYIF